MGVTMPLVDLGPADDDNLRERLLTVLIDLGFSHEDQDAIEIGLGATMFQRRGEAVSVYRDAWRIDLHGSEDVVQVILAHLSSTEHNL
jgi:hypothetical protein